MTQSRSLVATVLLLAALASCSKDDSGSSQETSSQNETATESETQHAPAGVEPGSHADWCGEHAVPESQCTRCNPDLTAAFKATGDWCEEHGLPESQCLECNPDLEIVRPPPPGDGEKEE